MTPAKPIRVGFGIGRTPVGRDLAALERSARNILAQCAHHRRHLEAGREDGVRALHLSADAAVASKIADRMARRFRKSRAKR